MGAFLTYTLQSDVAELTYHLKTGAIESNLPIHNLYFDVVTSEKTSFTADTTEYAVEKGANITDHVRTNPDSVSLEVIVSNEPISDDPQNSLGAIIGPIQIKPVLYTPPLNTSSVLSVLSLSGLTQAVSSGISPPAASPTSAQVLQFSNISQDRPSDVKALLISLKEKGVLVHVVTSTIDYDDMVITEISHERTVDTGTAFKGTLVFKHLRIVETSVVTAPKLARAVVSKSKGLRQPISTTVVPKKQSVASYLATLLSNKSETGAFANSSGVSGDF